MKGWGQGEQAILMASQEVEKHPFPSFRWKPESSILDHLQTIRTPVLTGVTASC
jgi:hypothetical protein